MSPTPNAPPPPPYHHTEASEEKDDFGVRSLNGSMLETRPLLPASATNTTQGGERIEEEPAFAAEGMEEDEASSSPAHREGMGVKDKGVDEDEDEDDVDDALDRTPGVGAGTQGEDDPFKVIMPDGEDFSPSSSVGLLGRMQTPRADLLQVFGFQPQQDNGSADDGAEEPTPIAPPPPLNPEDSTPPGMSSPAALILASESDPHTDHFTFSPYPSFLTPQPHRPNPPSSTHSNHSNQGAVGGGLEHSLLWAPTDSTPSSPVSSSSIPTASSIASRSSSPSPFELSDASPALPPTHHIPRRALPSSYDHRGRSGGPSISPMMVVPSINPSSTSNHHPLQQTHSSSSASSSGIGLASANNLHHTPPSSSAAAGRTAASSRTRQYAYSRSHWAVEEARRRIEEQGADVTLALPKLKLDLSAAGLKAGGKSAAASGPMGRPWSLLLCGTNRTTNAFLRALTEDARVEVFALVAGSGEGGVGESKRKKEKEGYQVGVFAAVPGAGTGAGQEEKEADEQGQDGEARMPQGEMVAVIQVMGKGQNGNLQRTMDCVEATYQRLDRLLADTPPITNTATASSSATETELEVDPSTVLQDMEKLVEGWITSGPEGKQSGGNLERKKSWFDLAVVTGDGRYLETSDSYDLDRITTAIPSICYPASLADRLSDSITTPFFSLGAAKEAEPKEDLLQEGSGAPLEPAQESSQIMDDFVAFLLGQGQDTQCSDVRKASVKSFMQWRAARRALFAVPDTPHFSGPASESSGGLSSSQLLPLPTLAVNPRSGNVRGDWEAGLSRRHAAARQKKSGSRGGGTAAGGVGQGSGPRRPSHSHSHGFFDGTLSPAGRGGWQRSRGLGHHGHHHRSPSILLMDPFKFLRRLFGLSSESSRPGSATPRSGAKEDVPALSDSSDSRGAQKGTWFRTAALTFGAGVGLVAVGWAVWQMQQAGVFS